MSDIYDSIVEITQSEAAQRGSDFREQINKWLFLGQSRHVCRYGTLSDGHEKITDAQRYAQAIKELYYVNQSINEHRINAMEAKADLLDAQTAFARAVTESDKLRASAKITRAESKLQVSLTSLKDVMRVADEYNKVYIELKDKVETQYPGGFEQAEPDNWKAVLKYRMLKEQTEGLPKELTSNVPLDPVTKAKLGIEFKRMDMIAPLIVANESEFVQIPHSPTKLKDFMEQIEHKEQELLETL